LCAIIGDLVSGRIRFADAARQYSACPSKEVGGSLGQIVAGQTTPDFEAALLAMEPGTITPEPVETRYGLHVILLERKIEGRALSFEHVHERIALYLAEAVRRRAQAQYVARLLGRAGVEGIELPTPGDLNVH
jgi:peptidyl-prolyl cis-trans isomerase C